MSAITVQLPAALVTRPPAVFDRFISVNVLASGDSLTSPGRNCWYVDCVSFDKDVIKALSERNLGEGDMLRVEGVARSHKDKRGIWGTRVEIRALLNADGELTS